MEFYDIQPLIRDLTDSDFQALSRWVVSTERKRREAEQVSRRAEASLIGELREEGVVEAPPEPADPTDPGTYPEWVDPGTIHSRMYLLGDRVQHQGRVWESGVDMLNSWEPGSAHTVWVDITDEITPEPEPEPDPEDPEVPEEPEEPEVPEWQTGVSYQVGDRVTYEGTTYEIIQAHTSAAHWPPNAVVSLYSPQ